MPFRPFHSDHAIAEVVLEVILDRFVTANDVQRLTELHAEKWQTELPSVKSGRGNISLRPGGVNPSVFELNLLGDRSRPSDATTDSSKLGRFEAASFKRDGTVEWRLLVDGNTVSLNCGAYTRWDRVWSRARDYISLTLGALGAGSGIVTAFALQYVDLFIWEGPPAEYDATLLMTKNPEIMPSAVLGRGPLWHAHTGWFIEPVSKHPDATRWDLPEGRLLERMNVDGLVREAMPNLTGGGDAQQPLVKFDSFCRFDFMNPLALSDGAILPELEACFGFLHVTNKRLVRAYLTEEIAHRINLNV